jgi:prepilin-type processing-associated H-X9-DG protein
MAVASDRNPWLDAPACRAKCVTDLTFLDPDSPTELLQRANTISHKGKGQNVLFVDGHTSFERQSFCGVNDDNIYTVQNGTDIRQGIPPTLESQPADANDSLLVHDPPRGTGK